MARFVLKTLVTLYAHNITLLPTPSETLAERQRAGGPCVYTTSVMFMPSRSRHRAAHATTNLPPSVGHYARCAETSSTRQHVEEIDQEMDARQGKRDGEIERERSSTSLVIIQLVNVSGSPNHCLMASSQCPCSATACKSRSVCAD